MVKSMCITKKIILKENKILKLKNVLIRELNESEISNIDHITYMMESYIKSKGIDIKGPLINHSEVSLDEYGNPKIIVRIMFQIDDNIRDIENSYKFESEVKVKNCIFARFSGSEENLQFAYQKLGVYAFENDIRLKGDSYTVFVNKESKNIVVDIFMECLRGESLLESI